MKRLVFLAIPLLLSAESFVEILKYVDKNSLLKSKDFEIKAKKSIFKSNMGKNYPTINASLNAIYLKEKPTMSIHIGFLGLPQKFQAASYNQYLGEISLKYPIFTGFAITNIIEKSKLNVKKSELEKLDIKRNLYLKTASLYSKIYSIKEAIKAAKEALKALNLSYKKAKGFYDQGLLPKSEVLNIEAKKYEIKANLEDLISKKETLFNLLGYLTNKKIKDVGEIKDINIDKRIDIENREDLRALKELLKMDEKDIDLAKSKYYPTIFAIGAIKGYGDDIGFDGDGYRNGDNSYVGFVIKQNIFNGFSDKESIEAAKYKKLSRLIYINDYKKKIITDLKNEISSLKSLKIKLLWAKKEIEAKKSYYKLIKGRFENQLASADELSRAIANLQLAKAKKADIKASIFEQKCKILLKESLKAFQKEFFH